MKKLKKIQINAEKLLRNDELLTLRGGYDGTLQCYTGKTTGSGATLYCGDCSYHSMVTDGRGTCG